MNDEKGIINIDLHQIERTAAICNALSSATRLEILQELTRRAMYVSEIADSFYLSMSSACFHVKILKDAGLITLQPRPGKRKLQKLCGIRVSQVVLDFFSQSNIDSSHPDVIENVPVGSFTDVSIKEPCGLVSGERNLFQEDNPYGFYAAERIHAALIWFTSGYVRYRISNQYIKPEETRSVEISFEACSEAPGYDNDWPSDITLNVNGFDIVTHRCKGDYGDVRGRFNPSWWSDSKTQHGELFRLVITHKECTFNGEAVSSHTIDSLRLREGYSFSFEVGVREDAVHVGGINLFGRIFGNYPQDILLRVSYT